MLAKRKIGLGLLSALSVMVMNCTYYQNEEVKLPQPKVSRPTATLEAEYVTSAPNSITAAY